MKHLLFGDDVTVVKTAILIKVLNSSEIKRHYLASTAEDINTFITFNSKYVNNKELLNE